jgi:DNA-binding LacI/PurR family transcriptional regulator
MEIISRRRPTAQDVARLSGVSRATVSYVLNKTPGQTIPEATQRRVLEAADSLGYVPSAAAQALARGGTDVVIIDISDIPPGERIAKAAHDLSEAFSARNYKPVINQYTAYSEGHSALLSLARAIVPAAVVAVNELPASVRDNLKQIGVQRVYSLSRGADHENSIGSAPAMIQVEYLVNKGHRKLLYVGTAEPNLRALNQARQRGAHAQGARVGATVETCSHAEAADLSVELAKRVREGATGVAAYNDEVAIAVLGAASRAGLSIPDQVAVMGVDDIPLAAVVHPRLTTVTIEPAEHPGLNAVVDHVLRGDPVEPINTFPRVLMRESA